MVPQFALDLSMDGIALLSRNEDGTWTRQGAVRLDDPDFNGAIARFRGTCVALGGEDFGTWLIIPDSQLLFTTLERDDRRPEETIRQNLVGRTPYDVDDLVFDYMERGDRLEVVVVAQETLLEAEDFGASNGFRPVALTANPSDGQYRVAPWFGVTQASASLTDRASIQRMDRLFEVSARAPAAAIDLPAQVDTAKEDLVESHVPVDGPLGGNPDDVAHVADMLAQAQREQAAPNTPVSEAPAPDETAPATAPPKTAPSFSSRRRNPTQPEGGYGDGGLNRIQPRLTGVSRAPQRRKSERPTPAAAAPAPEETAIAKVARLAVSSEPASQEPDSIIAPIPGAETAAPTPTMTSGSLDGLRAERGPVARSASQTDVPASRAEPDIDEQDEFLLGPVFAARGAPERPWGLYMAASIFALSILGLAGWGTATYLGGDRATAITEESAGPDLSELAALLPDSPSSSSESTDISAPAPIQLTTADDVDLQPGQEDTVAALEALPGGLVKPETDRDVVLAAATAADATPDTVTTPELLRPELPLASLDSQQGPATPRDDTPLAAPDLAETAEETETPAVATEVALATASTPTEETVDDPAPVVSLLETESGSQSAALEALLAAPVDEADRLAPADDSEIAAASAPTSVELETTASTSSASNQLGDAASLLAPTEEGVLAPGGYRLIAGRPEIAPEPRPGVENVVAVAAATDQSIVDPQILDPEEEARRAVLSRFRPVIRPRVIESAAAEADPGAAEAEDSDLETAEAEAAPEEDGVETEALAALRAVRPQPRPATLSVPTETPEPEAEAPVEQDDPAVIAAEQAATASLAAARAAAEATDQAEAEAARISPLALRRSERPDTRPRAVERTAARIVERRREAAATPASAPSAPRSSGSDSSPTIRSAGGSVARAATQRNQIRLNRIALIGTYGSSSNKRALVRMGNGRYVKVEVGDRLDRGRVIAIGDGVVRYQRSGRNMELTLPPI